jgi:ribosomal protein L37AE/L43A
MVTDVVNVLESRDASEMKLFAAGLDFQATEIIEDINQIRAKAIWRFQCDACGMSYTTRNQATPRNCDQCDSHKTWWCRVPTGYLYVGGGERLGAG